MTHPINLDIETMLRIDLAGIKLIEASAGTGKTYTIANLYLRHILAGRTPDKILVVTFTNAATEELRGRIRLRLHQALQMLKGDKAFEDEFLSQLFSGFQSQNSEQQLQQIRLLHYALRHMDESAISTIHGFCQRVLQNYALASFQFFDSELLTDDSSLWQSTIRDWWRKQTYQLDKGDWLLLINSVKSLSEFERNLNEIRNRSSHKFVPQTEQSLDDIFSSMKLLQPQLESLAKLWQRNKAELEFTLRNSKVLSRAKKLPYSPAMIDSFIEQVEEYFCSQKLLPIPDFFQYLASDVLHGNSTPSKRGTDKDIEHDFFLAANDVHSRILESQNLCKPQALIEAFEYCSIQLLKLKRKHNYLSYQDLLQETLRALQEVNGIRLATMLREQYPVAMIDEFQDTDALQFDIFRLLYFDQNQISLTLIGDPKQAIYSFRGGDIFTYMQAKQATGIEQYSLQTNWRSNQSLVNAVNQFFEYRKDSFIFSESIQFLPACAAEKNQSRQLVIDQKVQNALSIWAIPRDENNKPYNKENATALLNNAVVDEIHRLIIGGLKDQIQIEQRSLQSGDIAVLVRNAYQGESLRQALERKGIASVTIGKDKVFDSDEASGLFALLRAAAYCSDHSLLRAGLASSLLNFDHNEIAAITDHDPNWQGWVERFQQLHLLWLSRGFIAMFQSLLQQFELGSKLATRDQAERRLTNLLHLGELLQQQSLSSGGIDQMLNWFVQQSQENGADDYELRLESDDALVKIVTIHKSKGLEYPVIFLPYLWDCKSLASQKDGILAFHDLSLKAKLDLGSNDFTKNALLADRERLAEDVRLLYVALTRARCKVYLAWGEAGSRNRSGNSSQTALAYLLHSRQSADDLKDQPANGLKNTENLYSELQTFVDSAGSDIELSELPSHRDEQNLGLQQPEKPPPIVCEYQARNISAWRVNSFTSLTRDVHQVALRGSVTVRGDAILDFPAGSRVGLLLHSIFEQLDFQVNIEQQCRILIPKYAPRFDLDNQESFSTLTLWFKQVVNTSLNATGLTLSAISNRQRLNELAFDFALDQVDTNTLNQALAAINPHAEPLSVSSFRGLITGIIDLVFEYDGRFYIADYKSNFLGARLDDYTPDKLQQAMLDRRYDLQSLIYSVALHRYLQQRIRGYDYQQHFGGSYYLFLRAMREKTGMDYGVFFQRPTQVQIEMLDQVFGKPGRFA